MRPAMRLRAALAALVAALCCVMPAATATSAQRLDVRALRLMNYYPADAAWSQMWSDYSHARIAADFAAIASLHANAVRIIVQPQAVGYPVVRPLMLARFRDMLSTARAQGLSVQLTLFDWWAGYGDVAGSTRWLTSLLAGQKGNPTIALVELKNELPVTSISAVRWAQQMLPVLSTVLPGVPRTVSVSASSGIQGLAELTTVLPRTMLDVIDVHYYGDPTKATAVLVAARAFAAGRPVVVGEAGRSTLAAGSDQAQATFFSDMAHATSTLGLPPPSPWILSDFAPGAIPTANATPDEYHYGLRRVDGSWKPAASVVRSIFGGG